MKKLFVILISVVLVLSTATATGLISSDILKGGWKVFKSKKGLLIKNESLTAKGSLCCAFADGTKCYSSDCSACGCSGISIRELQKKDDAIQVKFHPQKGIKISEVLQAKDEGSSYCCTFSDGTKCYSSNCSFCGCSK